MPALYWEYGGESDPRIALHALPVAVAGARLPAAVVVGIQGRPEARRHPLHKVYLGGDHRLLLPGLAEKIVVVTEEPRTEFSLEQPRPVQRQDETDRGLDRPAVGPQVDESVARVLPRRRLHEQAGPDDRPGGLTQGAESRGVHGRRAQEIDREPDSRIGRPSRRAAQEFAIHGAFRYAVRIGQAELGRGGAS